MCVSTPKMPAPPPPPPAPVEPSKQPTTVRPARRPQARAASEGVASLRIPLNTGSAPAGPNLSIGKK